MSSQHHIVQATSSARVPTVVVRHKRRIDHAQIVRIAEAEAANRAIERHAEIATAAYFRAEKRGFEPGHELEDWLAAETDVAHARQAGMFKTGADAP